MNKICILLEMKKQTYYGYTSRWQNCFSGDQLNMTASQSWQYIDALVNYLV